MLELNVRQLIIGFMQVFVKTEQGFKAAVFAAVIHDV